LRDYFRNKAIASQLHDVVQKVGDNYSPLNLTHDINLQQSSWDDKINKWKQKSFHGVYPAVIANQTVDTDMSYKWLTVGYLYPESEGLIMAIQHQVIATKNYLKCIIKDPGVVNDDCRLCVQGPETIQHILAGCSMLAPTEYKLRHDNVGRIIHSRLPRMYSLLSDNTPYYQYQPVPVLDNETFKLYWDRSILTDKTIHHNRPDITIWDKINKKIWFIDFAVVNTNNLMTSYQLKFEVHSMQNNGCTSREF